MARSRDDIKIQYASLDVHARIVSVQAAAEVRTSNPEHDTLALAEALYEFIMKGTNDEFKRLSVHTKSTF